MTEQELLTDKKIPGKVVFDAIYFLNKLENTVGRVPAPGKVHNQPVMVFGAGARF